MVLIDCIIIKLNPFNEYITLYNGNVVYMHAYIHITRIGIFRCSWWLANLTKFLLLANVTFASRTLEHGFYIIVWVFCIDSFFRYWTVAWQTFWHPNFLLIVCVILFIFERLFNLSAVLLTNKDYSTPFQWKLNNPNNLDSDVTFTWRVAQWTQCSSQRKMNIFDIFNKTCAV